MLFKNEPKIVSEKEQDFNFTTFAIMEDLLEKLKLLNYEEEFLSGIKMKPLHKYYFVITKNPGEQFYLFAMLSCWLIRKLGKSMETPQEFDDPNDTIERILTVVRENVEYYRRGATIDFPPNKLKQGVGEHVVYILDNLANQALNQTNFNWERPKPPEEKEEEAEIVDDECELNLDRVEEEMMAAYSDDSDDENLFHIDQIPSTMNQKNNFNDFNDLTTIDEESWKLELERILPKLKITIRNDNRDWRTHLEQMKQLESNIDGILSPVKNQLEKLSKEITINLDKINNREKYLNRELDAILNDYRLLQDQLSKIKDKYKNLNSGVVERNRELTKLNDRLETVKQQMEERGSSMTDGTPLVNIKKSISKIKSEIIDMDIRIGVLETVLLQTKVHDEKLLESEFGQTITVF